MARRSRACGGRAGEARRAGHGASTTAERGLRIETADGTIDADAAIVTLSEQPDRGGSGPLLDRRLPREGRSRRRAAARLDDKLFFSLEGAEDFEKDTRLFGHIDRAATAAYHFRPFGRPLIEAYFGGTLAAELEAGGEPAFVDFAIGELTAPPRRRLRNRMKPLRMHSLGRGSLRARLLFACAAGQGGFS